MIGKNGFPSISSITTSAIKTGVLGRLESAVWDLLSLAPKWGVYIDNALAVEVDSVLSVEHRSSSRISTYRLMTGSFASFNKVSDPTTHRITMAVGGDQTRRETFLGWLEEQKENPTVFDVVTPEKTFKSVSLEDFRIQRSAENGTVSRIIAECSLVEVREVAAKQAGQEEADTTNAENEADKPTTETGFVQTITYRAKTAWESVKAYATDTVNKVKSTIDDINEAIDIIKKDSDAPTGGGE